MKYTKTIHGWVQQTYDLNGNCIEQKWVQNESMPVERRAVREEKDGTVAEDQLEDDELIEHPEDVEYLESREKFCEIVVNAPPPPLK